MDKITAFGIDPAKSVFQLLGVDAEGCVVLRRRLRRSQMLEFFQGLRSCLEWSRQPIMMARIGAKKDISN